MAEFTTREEHHEKVADRLECALSEKLDENVFLLQQLLEKEALLKEATTTIASVQTMLNGVSDDVAEKALSVAEKVKPKTSINVSLEAQTGSPKAILAPTAQPAKQYVLEKSNEVNDSPPVLELHPTGEITNTNTNTNTKERVVVGEKLAPYNPTNDDACKLALDLMNVTVNDVLYDLGCGDARLLIQACHRFYNIDSENTARASASPAVSPVKFRGIGVEYDSEIYNKAINLLNTSNEKNTHIPYTTHLTLLHDNVMNIDFSDATCIFIYLVSQRQRHCHCQCQCHCQVIG